MKRRTAPRRAPAPVFRRPPQLFVMNVDSTARFGIQELAEIEKRLEREGIEMSTYHAGGITLEQITLAQALKVIEVLPPKMQRSIRVIGINKQDLIQQAREIPIARTEEYQEDEYSD